MVYIEGKLTCFTTSTIDRKRDGQKKMATIHTSRKNSIQFLTGLIGRLYREGERGGYHSFRHDLIESKLRTFHKQHTSVESWKMANGHDNNRRDLSRLMCA